MTEHVLCVGGIAEPVVAALRQRYTIHRAAAAEAAAPNPQPDWPKIRVVVTGGVTGARATLIDALPALELIAVTGIGLDSVDLDRCRARGIAVRSYSDGLKTVGATTAHDGTRSDVMTDDVADAAMALLLAANRNVAFNDAFVRRGDWGTKPIPAGTRVTGKRLGIFGFGNIGRAIARRAQGFDMAIAYASRSAVAGDWRRFDDLAGLAAWCDALVVAVPGGPETRGAVDAGVLRALGPDGVLVNIARGSIVDEEALIAALRDGTIRAAGLDVFQGEPNVPEALRALPNVVLTPHQGTTKETRKLTQQIVIGIVDAHLGGG